MLNMDDLGGSSLMIRPSVIGVAGREVGVDGGIAVEPCAGTAVLAGPEDGLGSSPRKDGPGWQADSSVPAMITQREKTCNNLALFISFLPFGAVLNFGPLLLSPLQPQRSILPIAREVREKYGF